MKAEIILGRIFLVVISTIIGFIVLDYVSTWFISSRSPIEQRFPVQEVRQPKPYTMFGGSPNAGDLNSLGYRGKAPATRKEKDEFRVFMLGGSTVFEGDPPIPQLLEEHFSKSGSANVKVYNFGVVSSVSSMELIRTLLEISELEPDLIIFYNGGNDILHPWSYDPRPGYPFNFIAYESNPLLESDVKEYPAFAMFAYGSNLARFLFPDYFTAKFTRLAQLRLKANRKSEGWKEAIADIYVANLNKANKISRAFDAKFIAFFQPMIFSKVQFSNTEKQIYIDDRKEYALEMQEKIRTKLNEAKKDSSLMVIDITGIYDSISENIFVDDIHTVQPAKNVIAERIYAEIRNENLINE